MAIKSQGGFTSRLKEQLTQSGLSQSDLAKSLGVSAASISQWLKGKKTPTGDNIAAIAESLNAKPEWLLYGAGPAPLPDLIALRNAYKGKVGWRFRLAPHDEGRDYGNANVWAFEPKIPTAVRDIVQNCRDAELTPGAPVQITFKVVRLFDGDLDAFKKAVNWEEVYGHLEASAEVDQRLGRMIKHHIAEFEKKKELLLLVVEDRGTIGLLGEEFGKGNFAALCRNNLDSDKNSVSAGGAFGLGKAVLWRDSQFSLVLFASHLSEPTASGKQFTRVFGRCDLPWHEVSDARFAGPGWFGGIEDVGGQERATSYWDNDALAHDLHLDRRDRSCGTSIAVVGFHDPSGDVTDDPIALSDEIERAVADWFWPDLAGGRLSVQVEVWSGRTLDSRVEVSPAKLQPEFVDAIKKWESGDVTDQLRREGDVVEKRVQLHVPTRRQLPRHPAVAHEAVVLVRRASDEKSVDHTNDLAMFRGVRMVVKYQQLNRICLGALPFHAVLLCGEAVGDDASCKMADRFLRTSEPPAHHEWTSTPDLKTEYKLGGKTAIDTLIAGARAAIRDVVRPPLDDRSDGPRALKELLNIGGTPTETDRPAIDRPAAELDSDGRWNVQAQIRVKRGDDAWRVQPVVAFQAETGGGQTVAWSELEAVSNCEVVEGQRLLIPPHVNRATFKGKTDTETHPVAAEFSCVTIELRRAQREEGSNS